ncbi:hypothetical protein D5086_029435 [Populus alba]|uniref:Uncharacterized protein n=1 Tax=Populus alba TaxID=43335 RepID=A0ACC4ATI2_POPAL
MVLLSRPTTKPLHRDAILHLFNRKQPPETHQQQHRFTELRFYISLGENSLQKLLEKSKRDPTVRSKDMALSDITLVWTYNKPSSPSCDSAPPKGKTTS